MHTLKFSCPPILLFLRSIALSELMFELQIKEYFFREIVILVYEDGFICADCWSILNIVESKDLHRAFHKLRIRICQLIIWFRRKTNRFPRFLRE